MEQVGSSQNVPEMCKDNSLPPGSFEPKVTQKASYGPVGFAALIRVRYSESVSQELEQSVIDREDERTGVC